MAVQPVRKRPGLYYDTNSKSFFNLVEFRDEDKYDTVSVASGLATAGYSRDLFKDLGSKKKIDSNFDTPRRLTQGEEMLIRRVGTEVPQVYGNIVVALANAKKVLYGGYLNVQVNGFDVANGPLTRFPTGYGMTGQTTENAASLYNNGIPSTASVRNLEKAHEITSDHDITGTIVWDDRTWDSANMMSTSARTFVRVYLGGLVRKAATK